MPDPLVNSGVVQSMSPLVTTAIVWSGRRGGP